MFENITKVNLDAWFPKLSIDVKLRLFNFCKFGMRCPKHKHKMKLINSEHGGGGIDDCTGEKLYGDIFSWVRETYACPTRNCRHKVLIYIDRKDLKEKKE